MTSKTTHHKEVAYIRRQQTTTTGGAGGWVDVQGNVVLEWDDIVTYGPNFPDWRYRLAKRLSATTSLDGTRIRVTGANNDGSITSLQRRLLSPGVYNYRTVEVKGSLGAVGYISGTLPDTSILSYVNAQALSRFVHKAYQARSKIQTLVAFGELGETLRMIRSPAKALFGGIWDYLRAVRKRTKNPRLKPPDAKRLVSDTWLEYSFGWSPLLNDAKNAAQALSVTLNGYTPNEYIVGKASSESSTPGPVGSVDAIDIHYSQRGHFVGETSVRYTGSVSHTPPTYPPFLDAFGLTWGDFLPSLWELIPYSFVVDYFTNCGNIIESLSVQQADLDWCEKGTWRSIETIVDVYDFRQILDPGLWEPISFTYNPGTKFSYKKFGVSREAYTGSLIPSLVFTIPGLGLQWLNLAALFTSSRSTQRYLQGRFGP